MTHLEMSAIQRLALAFMNRHRPCQADRQLGKRTDHIVRDFSRRGVVLVSIVLPLDCLDEVQRAVDAYLDPV